MFLKKQKILLTVFLIFTSLLCYIKSEVVCSEDELVRELIEDLEDNGKLDCLRESVPADENEKPEQKAKRLAANWDSDCSFEAESENFHWKTRLEKYYGLTKGLVDVDGLPVENDFEDQADMCEMVRALVANSKFKINFNNFISF
jgi:2,4-dienoyl-CoA reductase-like NADH-dependent reductase (Old Yellow Enzyme family)